MGFFIYVLKSIQDGGYYIGMTHNITVRLRNHNDGFVKSTKNRRPLDIVYTEEFKTKHEALIRERFLKKQKGGDVFYKIINNHYK